MDKPINTASWRYKMDSTSNNCCLGTSAFGQGGINFLAFRRYASRNNINRNKILMKIGRFNTSILPTWALEDRVRRL